MGVAIVLPWLLFQQLAPLTIKEAELSQYTDMAQQTIHERQFNLQWWTENQAGISILTFLAGVAVTIHGLQGWKERQQVTDDKEKEELRSLLAAAPASEAEVSKRLESEVEDAIAEIPEEQKTSAAVGNDENESPLAGNQERPPSGAANVSPTAELRRYETRLKIKKFESRLGEVLDATLGATHVVTRNARLSVEGSTSAPIHDVIAVPRTTNLPVYVFDIRFTTQIFPGRVTESAVRMVADIEALPMDQRDRVRSCVVFVESRHDEGRKNFRPMVSREIDNVKAALKRRVGIVILGESDFESLTYEELSVRFLESTLSSET